jgi:all-trans-nonaprenyl-diphosphate synthase
MHRIFKRSIAGQRFRTRAQPDVVRGDLDKMNLSLKNVVGNRHPMLHAAADQIFGGGGGKQLRPTLVFLVARATAPEVTEKHRRLAEIVEMIHTASLVHDDVLDEAGTRRGKQTINSRYGTRTAVLTGDFLFAQSSWSLASLDNLEVIKTISRVIADFADGEIAQAASKFDTGITMEQYLDKSFCKTASLIAASCKSAAVISRSESRVADAMYDYGRHLGLAFQVVDDILDFTRSSEDLGKPQGQDLASGILTAPVIFSLTHEPALADLIESEFVEEGSLQRALAMVNDAGGIQAARALAWKEVALAQGCLKSLPDGPARTGLEHVTQEVLGAMYLPRT